MNIHDFNAVGACGFNTQPGLGYPQSWGTSWPIATSAPRLYETSVAQTQRYQAPTDGYTLTIWGYTHDQVCNAQEPEGIIEALLHMMQPLGDGPRRLIAVRDMVERLVSHDISMRISR